MEKTEFICDKCGNNVFEIVLYQPPGALFDEIYGKATKKIICVSCKDCGNMGIYKTATDTVADIILSSYNKQNQRIKE